MTRFLLTIGLACALLPLSRGAENILALLKGPCGVEDIKRQLDVTPPQDLNTLADDEGKTGLFYCRHLGTTLLLLDGADPNVRDHTGRTPAFRAVSKSRDVAFPIMLDLLALAHADLNAQDNDHVTLLARAAQEDNLPAVRMLLLLGANPTPSNVPGDRTPLFYALQQHDDKMTSLLNQSAESAKGEAVSGTPDERLAEAAQAGRLGPISEALAAGANINAKDQDGATALFRAVADRRAETAALLLLKGANPNLAKNDGKTPLMQCVTHFDMASERMLVDLIVAGADVNATAKDGATALSWAVDASNNTGAQWMIWRGASLEVHAPTGTLMQTATAHPDWPSAIDLLKKAGLKEEAPVIAKEKSFILFNAVRAGDVAAVETELQHGTPADVTNQYDQTALEWAACYDRFDIVDLLMRHGADINHQHYYNGEHLMHTKAATKGHDTRDAADKMQKLLDRGANPNLKMHDGCTPLMVAAREGTTGPGLDLLVKVTSDINARDQDGLTALDLAREHGHGEIVKVLQSHGALE